MKVNESYDILQNYLGKILHFHSLSFICDVLGWLSPSLLTILKYDHIILISLRQFQNFELLYLPIMKVKKFSIAIGPWSLIEHRWKMNLLQLVVVVFVAHLRGCSADGQAQDVQATKKNRNRPSLSLKQLVPRQSPKRKLAEWQLA